MRSIQIFFIMAACMLATACAQIPSTNPNPVQRTSTDYVAVGKPGDASAYVYGNVTVLEFKTNPTSLLVKDESGTPVAAEKIGYRYRLPRKLENFTLEANGSVSTFVYSGIPAAVNLARKPRHGDGIAAVAAASMRPANAGTQVASAAELSEYQLLVSDVSLRGSIARWAKFESYDLVWDLPPALDPKITRTSTFTAPSLKDAVGLVVQGLRAKGYPVEANVFTDRVIQFTQKQTP